MPLTQFLGWAGQRWGWRGEACGNREVLRGENLLAGQIKSQVLLPHMSTEHVPEVEATKMKVSVYTRLNPLITA